MGGWWKGEVAGAERQRSPTSCDESPHVWSSTFPWHKPTAKMQKRHNHGNWPQNLKQWMFGLHLKICKKCKKLKNTVN